MNNFENLERLQKLRESGALTEAEFQDQKEQLLSPSRGSLNIPILIAVVVGIILLAALIWTISGDVTEREITTAETNFESENTEALTEPNSVQTNGDSFTAPSDRYKWATSTDVIGLNPSYLESKLGPARNKDAESLTYDLDGCIILYSVKKSEIVMLNAVVTEQCHPNGVTEKTTFGQVMAKASGGKFVADCVYSCGNLYDPDIELYYSGYRANQFIDESFSTQSFNGASGDPLGDWADAILKANGLSIQDTPSSFDIFNCVTNPPAQVANALKNARIETISLGRNLRDNCE